MKYFGLLLILVLTSFAVGRVEVICDVQRATSGSSFSGAETVRRSVDFMTGRELNRATRTYAYGAFSRYALLWFSQAEVAILEHTGFASVTGDFEISDVKRIFGTFGYADFQQINGSSRVNYRITCRSWGRWIDPLIR